MIARIKELAKKRNAIILAHNYQPPEIQDLADLCGDSLELSRKAAQTDAQVIVYLGILQDYQGIPHLIQAAKPVLERHPNTYFLIMGFPNQARYRQLAQSVGVSDRVLFPGRVPREQNPSHLALGDIAAAPKLSATEGAAKLLYYMAMALPVVAFDTPVSQEYLGEWGMCAEPGRVSLSRRGRRSYRCHAQRRLQYRL